KHSTVMLIKRDSEKALRVVKQRRLVVCATIGNSRTPSALARLFPSLITDNSQHHFGISGLLEGLAKLGPVQQLGDIGQRVQVLLELALRDQKKHHQIHGLIIEGVKTDSLFRAAQRTNDFMNQVS